ncbi:thiol:disulfide interchange protein [Aurantiacibacter luteus]|uniref:Thiol:disulfide interchange protein n=2 Tax=Aurantiacibacter luteus TaxID=1581420 RepID=A0A0G9MW88_9SPHN|nr:thioredoxin family protein [Aurantiacibacter luteus]KLE34991.1 thiol:disulfide interchange protein [Aurantiacibacter luteus]
MQASLTLMRYLLAALLLWAHLLFVMPADAQAPLQANRIAADLVAEHAPVPGETLTVALRFRPQEGWHGYWSNPGEAGLGMTLDWRLPPGWRAGEPQYPVPELLWLFDIANHAYERDYAVLVPLEVPEGAMPGAPVTLDAQWLACSDQLCVPERATLTLRYPQASPAFAAQFDADRAAIPPPLESRARFAFSPDRLRLAIPLPAAMTIGDPHVFIAQQNLVDYGAVQTYSREGDLLVAEIPRGGLREEASLVGGILAFGNGEGVRFEAVAGDVPTGGRPLRGEGSDAPLWLLLGGALLGGLLLNLMPCVFPILSLKALTLARVGESEAKARAEGVAYTAGVVLACTALGAIMLLLRGAGEQVGWAFQLQQPLVVAALLVLAVLVTANLAGLFELPMLPIRSGGRMSAFATGLLAAVVATPCTGPFMAAAMGAALLLPAPEAMLLFAALGLGLALPFLLLGFVPPLRRLLPRPGAWMERFRRIMAVPMGLTALALVWLAWRLGGLHFAFAALALGVLLVTLFVAWRWDNLPVAAIAGAVALYFVASLPFRAEEQAAAAEASLLDPVPFSETALAEARASGRPVFLWFTADWCVTCKVNERVAIEREDTRAAFAAAGVTAVRGDWTRADPAITRFLEAQGAAGVPLYLWYPAGGGTPEQLPQILTPAMLAQRAAR